MLERAVKSFAKTGRFDESFKLVEELLSIAPEDARRPSRPDGERPPREGERTGLLDVRPHVYGGPPVSSDSMPPQHSHDDYVKSVEMMRREKDYFFKEDRESPIPHALRAKFDGLAYYLPDPKYRVRAKLVKDPNPQKVVLATSKGVPRDM